MDIVTRRQSGIPTTVTNSNGSRRPALATGLRTLTVHYTGASGALAGNDPLAAFKSLHQFAINERKPYEYNYVITWDGQVFEFAGLFQAAHSASENLTSIGVQFHNAVGEPLLDAQLVSFLALRRHLVEIGALSAGHVVVKHREMPGASTPCPGEAIERRWDECTVALEALGRGHDNRSDHQHKQGEELDMATINDFEAVLRNVLNESTGDGLLDFDDTIREILRLGRTNFNDLQALKAEVAALREQLPPAA